MRQYLCMLTSIHHPCMVQVGTASSRRVPAQRSCPARRLSTHGWDRRIHLARAYNMDKQLSLEELLRDSKGALEHFHAAIGASARFMNA